MTRAWIIIVCPGSGIPTIPSLSIASSSRFGHRPYGYTGAPPGIGSEYSFDSAGDIFMLFHVHRDPLRTGRSAADACIEARVIPVLFVMLRALFPLVVQVNVPLPVMEFVM